MARGKKTGGRRPGSLNKATVEAKAACAALVDDPIYRQRLATRLRAGKLSPAVECMLWHYAKGKPRDDIQASQDITVTWQRPDWLEERLHRGRERVVDARARQTNDEP